MQLAGRTTGYIPGTIAAGGTLSNEIILTEYAILGLISEESIVSGTLNFWVSRNSDTDPNHVGYVQVRSLSDGAVRATGTVAGALALGGDDLSFLAPFEYLKIETGAAQTNGLKFYIPVKA